MREFGYVAGWILGVSVLMGVIGVGLNAAGLLYLPFSYHQQTRIVHNSQGYIDSTRQQLRAFKVDYDVASNETQKSADLRQMQELADQLQPYDIQPDIASLLGR